MWRTYWITANEFGTYLGHISNDGNQINEDNHIKYQGIFADKPYCVLIFLIIIILFLAQFLY